MIYSAYRGGSLAIEGGLLFFVDEEVNWW